MSTSENVIRKYSGTGIIEVDRNQQIACTFEAIQLVKGSIRLSCQIQASIHPQAPCRIKLSGTTDQGKPLTLEGPCFCKSNTEQSRENIYRTELSARFHGETKLQVGESNWQDEVEIRFALTNFFFPKYVSRRINDLPNQSAILSLKILDKEVNIYRISDFEEHIERIRSTQCVDVTCEARIKLRIPEEPTSTCELMSNICLLLSLARGTLVSWIFYEVVSSNDQAIYAEHQPYITRPYSAWSIINKPETIQEFVETTYERYTQLDPLYHFRKVIHTYITAKSDDIFLESRALVLISLVEYLVGTRARIKKQNTIIEPEVFKEKKDDLRKATERMIEEAFSELDEMEQLKKSAVDKICSLNNKFSPFRRKIDAFVKDKKFKTLIDEDKIEEFVKTRNSLVHEMRFQTDTKEAWDKEYRPMLHVVDKLLLGLIGYKGHYIDALDKIET